jgi:hypothetical protein
VIPLQLLLAALLAWLEAEHVSRCTLARARGGRLLHDGDLDGSRPRDVLYRVRDRTRVATCPVVRSTHHPDEAFVIQAIRHLTDGVEEVLGPGRVLICDRDPK